jgi:hypothetical protein
MNISWRGAIITEAVFTVFIAVLRQGAFGFQIAPLSSEWEETLTRESTTTRAKKAGKPGRACRTTPGWPLASRTRAHRVRSRRSLIVWGPAQCPAEN